MNSTTPLLEFRNISKTFPGVKALDNVSFAVQHNSVHALLGANGAGKSTLIKILAGAIPRDSGDILLQGKPTTISNPHEAAQLGLTFIFQEPALISEQTVTDNIFLGQEILNRFGLTASKRQWDKAAELLRPLAPHINPRQLVRTLRTSERQLVSLARALLSGDKVVVMDEPSASMTENELRVLFDAIRQLKASGVSVIYISHRLEEVFEIADVVTVLRDGHHVSTGPVSDVSRGELVSLIVGREMRGQAKRENASVGDELLVVENLTRHGAFKNISFSVRAGEIIALAGLVGAGRSEIARAILGADAFDSGRIRYPKGYERIGQPTDAVRAGLVMIPEDRKDQGIIPKMTVGENMMLASIHRYVQAPFGLIQNRQVDVRIEQNVQQLNIQPPGAKNRAIQTLSGGNQQKVLVARAIESQADVLIIDEPTAGVDVGAKAEIHKLIFELANQGKGVLLISSETEEVLTLADRILIIRAGELVGELEGQSASSHDLLTHALGEFEPERKQ